MKTTLSLLFVILFSNLSIAQTTAIPDPNFEQALINLGLDSGPIDGVVLTANIDTVTELIVMFQNISDLTGIEDFSSLSRLDCQWNQLNALNLSQNNALTYLNCVGNQLTSLSFTQNTALNFLWCSSNQLINLDVTQNSALEILYCGSNQINNLNLSQNMLLSSFSCWNNDLNCLNLKNGNNSILNDFSAKSNPNLTCIEVDNVAWSTTNWTNIDPQTSFSTNCSNPCTVGVNENSLSSLSLYPNPTTGNVFIDFGELKQNIKATVTNSIGQVVLTQNYVSTKSINFDLDLPKGLYFLTLESDGEVISKKLIKQ